MSAGKINLQANDGAVIGLVVPDGLTSGERQISFGANLSGATSYNILQGSLETTIKANYIETSNTTTRNYTTSDYIFDSANNKLYDCILASTAGVLLTNTTYFTSITAGTLSVVNALIPLAKGIDVNGVKNSIVVANETITGVTYTAGKNYLYKTDSGYGVSLTEPLYKNKVEIITSGENYREYEFDVSLNKWVDVESTLNSEEIAKETTLDFFGDGSCKALYTLNGNINDISGNFNGTASSLTYVDGKFGQGARIVNGSYITLASSPFNFVTSNTTPWTYSFWCVDALDLSSGQASLCSYTNANGYCAFAIGANAISGFAHSVPGGGSGTLYTGNSELISWFNRVIPANTLVTIVNTGSGFKLYENGKLGLSTGYNTTTGSGNITGNRVIGSSVNGSGYTFNGGTSTIDQIRVFNRALSDTEVKRLSTYYDYSYSDGEARNYMNHIVHADNDGGVLYVEELPKIEYKDIIKANEFQGKNACTAWAFVDNSGATPIIKDGVGFSGVIRTATGVCEVIPDVNFSDTNYGGQVTQTSGGMCEMGTKYLNKVTVITRQSTGAATNYSFTVEIKGGRN